MLELLKMIKRYVEEGKIKIEKVNFDILLSQDSTLIDKIIKADEDCNKLALIYLLSNENFNSEFNKSKKDIIDYVSSIDFANYLKEDLLTLEDIIAVMTNARVLAREDAKEIIRLITNAKDKYQARYGSKAASNPRVLARENYREILDLIVADDGTDKNYEEIFKKIDAEIQKPQKPEEFYKSQFKANEYIDFMNILENNSEGQIGQFIKKFNKLKGNTYK